MQVIELEQSNLLKHAFTCIRNKELSRREFVFYSDRIIGWLIDAALNTLPFYDQSVTTPTECPFIGLEPVGNICGVSIMRAGESMETVLRQHCPAIAIGKILIQRDEETALPKLFYEKLPKDISNKTVLLLDPMLATGGSAIMAVKVLIEKGVPENRIIFVNLIACPEGIEAFHKEFPQILIITGCIDQGLNDQKYIIPGLGDFGCRYFGTD